MGQTVNLLAYAYGGSNPSAPTKKTSGSSSFGRAIAFQAIGGRFEPGLPLIGFKSLCSSGVEHFLGKEEVGSSILLKGSVFKVGKKLKRRVSSSKKKTKNDFE
jgi:hypothetical protein